MMIDETIRNKFQATATFCSRDEGVGTFESLALCDTNEQADSLAASFPKYVKVCRTRIGHGGGRFTPMVTIYINLRADGVNGGVNERGIKRVRKFLEIAEVEYKACYGNSYKTLEDFLAAISIGG